MKEHPILFNSEMVRAIIQGRKTQTRRIIGFDWEPRCGHPEENIPGFDLFQHKKNRATAWSNGVWHTWDNNGVGGWNSIADCVEDAKTDAFNAALEQGFIVCPYGKPGDRLWVRETFAWIYPHAFSSERYAIYRADYRSAKDENGKSIKWIPSIHMPRNASRILLEIISIGVERLRDISEADAQAEGLERPVISDMSKKLGFRVHPMTGDYRDAMKIQWDSIYNNDYRGNNSWENNPFVWAIEFKKVEA